MRVASDRYVFLLIDIPEAGLTLASHNPGPANQRTIFGRLSIAAGNTWQGGGIAAACLALAISRSVQMRAIAVITMLLSWVLLYFSSHAIAHWLVGRLVGIHFLFYTVGGTSNPQGWPMGLRWFFQHLPFMGVQTDKASMLKANPRAKALMWCAGVTSSAITPTLGAFWACRSAVPGSTVFFIFALLWALGTLASNWTSRTGDYSKARLALHQY